MNKLISLVEPVVSTNMDEGPPLEISATAEGEFDPGSSVLTVRLDTVIHQGVMPEADHRAWLPAAEVVHEHVDQEEATVVARDVFEHWVEKVRRAVSARKATGNGPDASTPLSPQPL
jgi:hypothetical protein